jgi:two-component system, cell cycle response regulator CtrA
MQVLRILMVEDDVNIAAMYSFKLELDGMLVQAATSGESALMLARQSEWDLVLLDIELPGISGLEVLAALREHARTTAWPVFILSNSNEAELIDRAFVLGAIDFLVKAETSPSQLSSGVQHWATTQRQPVWFSSKVGSRHGSAD